MIYPASCVRLGRTAAHRPISTCQRRTFLVNTKRSIKLTCSAVYLDASDSESEAGVGHVGDHHHRAAHVLPELENWTDDEGLLPVRHPGSFPNAGVHTEVAQEADAEDFDPLRDGPLRYLGYANELGEAFAAWLPAFGVPASYCIALGYVLVDTYDKTAAAHTAAQTAEREAASSNHVPDGVDWNRIVGLLTSERAIDTLLWQVLASVVIPGFTIHQVVYFVHLLLENTAHLGNSELMPVAVAAAVASGAEISHQSVTQVAGVVDKMVPTMAGIAAIPLIVHPIDNAVHMLLNSTLRPYMQSVICDGARGKDAGLEICEVVLPDDEPGHEDVRGPAVSSFNYGACLDEEGCSVVSEYYKHSGDAKSRNLKLALGKAFLLTAPVAWALLATHSLN